MTKVDTGQRKITANVLFYMFFTENEGQGIWGWNNNKSHHFSLLVNTENGSHRPEHDTRVKAPY